MLNAERHAGPSIVVLVLTPPYLSPLCHEALHEIDLSVLTSEFEATEERERRKNCHPRSLGWPQDSMAE